MLIALAPLLLLPGAHVEVRDNPPAFALEAGFIEAVPETPVIVVIDDAAPQDELAVDVVRIGPLGKGRCHLVVTVEDSLKRRLAVLAPTVQERKVGKLFASLPVHQRVPLPTGTSVVQIKVDEPMGLKIGVERAPPPGEIPLVPLSGPVDDADDAPAAASPAAPPAAPPATAPESAPPAPSAAPATASPAPPPEPAAPPVDDTAPPAKPAAAPVHATAPPPKPAFTLEAFPKLSAEVHAGGALVAGGLQGVVPAGGVRVMLGPRSLDASLGFALDFDGQATVLPPGVWNAASTRVRLEGMMGVGWLGFFDAALNVSGGAGLRFTWHSVRAKGIKKDILVVGGTARLEPEAAFDAGPGRFTIGLPLDVNADLSPDVRNFAPFAAGLALGYRLEL